MMKIFDMQTSAKIPAHKIEKNTEKGEQKYVGENQGNRSRSVRN